MKRFFRDLVRRLAGTTGEAERAKQARYERRAERAESILHARAAQTQAQAALLATGLNAMRQKE